MRERETGEGGIRRDKGSHLQWSLSPAAAGLLADEDLVGTRGMVIQMSAGR